MRVILHFLLVFSMTMGLLISCGGGDDNEGGENGNNEVPVEVSRSFDRGSMLEDWADLIIIPAFNSYSQKIVQLVATKDAFIADPSSSTIDDLRQAHLSAYICWQRVAMFDIGKAEEIGLSNFTNVYPTNIDSIEAHVASQSFNLELPSNFAAQGFPALDYLLYGLGESDDAVLSQLQSSGYSHYLDVLVSRLSNLTDEVVTDWNGNYRATFINDDGASATASTDRLVNDFLFYYERFLRAGKIGIPSGVFSVDPLPATVESFYSKTDSKILFMEGLSAVEAFFRGASHDDKTVIGESLESYIRHIEREGFSAGLADDILSQLDSARSQSELLSDDFTQQIATDNSVMRATYDELQKAVILLKVDMMQAFNIQVDFIDADGD